MYPLVICPSHCPGASKSPLVHFSRQAQTGARDTVILTHPSIHSFSPYPPVFVLVRDMTSVASLDIPNPDGRRLPTRVSQACERCRRNKSRVSTLFYLLNYGIIISPTKHRNSVIRFARALFVRERMSNAPRVAFLCPRAVAHQKGNAHEMIHVMILSLRTSGLTFMRHVRLRPCSSLRSSIPRIPMMAPRLLEKLILAS
jgi:hypothetical protein